MRRDMLSVLGIKIGSVVAGFLGFAVLSNVLDVQAYGLFATMFSAALFMSIPLMGGLNFSLVRHLADVSGNLALCRRLIGLAMLRMARYFAAAVGLAVLVYAAAMIFAPERLAAIGAGLGLASVLALAGIYAASEVTQSVIRVFDGSVRAFAPREMIWRASFFAVAGLAALSPLFQAPWVVVALIALALAVVVLAQVGTSSVYRASAAPAGAADALLIDADIRRSSFGFLLVGLLSTSTQHLIVLLSALVLTAVDTAHFFNAFKLMQVLALSIFAVNFVLAPRLRGLAGAGASDFAAVSKVCITGAWFNTLFSLAGIAVFAVAGGWMLSLFGADYGDDKGLLLLLCLAALINAATGPAGFVLVMFDLQRQFNVISAVSIAVGAAVAAVMGWLYGLTGFAAGYVVWAVVQNLSTAGLCWLRLGVNSTILGIPKVSVMRRVK